MNRQSLFTDFYKHLDAAELEAYHRTVIMHMDTPQAAAARLEYYKSQLRHMGKNVKIGIGVSIINPQNVSLGDDVQIGDHCYLIAKSKKGISLDAGARLKYGVYLDTESSEGYIKIGKKVYIGTGCCLHGHAGLEIGDFSLLAQNITITPASHIFENPDEIIYNQPCTVKKIIIGRDCYLGMNVCVVCSAGVIGDGSVIGAGAVVVKEIPPYSVATGVPAKVIKKRERKN